MKIGEYKHSKETLEKLRISHLGKKQSADTIEKRVSKFRGVNHWAYTGEKKCLDCGKKRYRYSVRCRKCSDRFRVGENHHSWKGGYENHLSHNKRRRVTKLGNGGFHTAIEWVELKKKYEYMCLCCKKYEPDVILTEDHIIPLSKGGTDYISNIQPLCKKCNSKKYSKTIDYRTMPAMASLSVR